MIPRFRPVGLATLELALVGDAMRGQDLLEDIIFLSHGMDNLALLLDGDIGRGNLLGVSLA